MPTPRNCCSMCQGKDAKDRNHAGTVVSCTEPQTHSVKWQVAAHQSGRVAGMRAPRKRNSSAIAGKQQTQMRSPRLKGGSTCRPLRIWMISDDPQALEATSVFLHPDRQCRYAD